METKVYTVKTIQEAMKLIRTELGEEAVVLHTRQVTGSRLLEKVIGKKYLEVTAAIDVEVPKRLSEEMFSAEPSWEQSLQSDFENGNSFEIEESEEGRLSLFSDYRETNTTDPQSSLGYEDQEEDVRGAGSRYDKGQGEDFLENQRDTVSFRRHEESFSVERQAGEGGAPYERLEAIVSSSGRIDEPFTKGVFEVYSHLIDQEIDPDVARSLIEGLQEREGQEVYEELFQKVRQGLEVTGPIATTPGRQRIVALVGTTGVGKTTTIAKLAADYRLRKKYRVGLITVDTYRIAAVDQLRTYAEIIDLPMEVVSTPKEMRQAIDRLSGLDLIFLDTAGRSPQDALQLQELRSMLLEARADEVQLVLSSVTSSQNIRKSIEQFSSVGVTSLLLTKLDEAFQVGHLLGVLQEHSLPVSYLTTGQNVPDDIEVARQGELAKRLLGLSTPVG
ncbi:MAG: flagellar biosynthesis protein FlhF [Pirellulaceae bacterium]|nr:flagellar biosynthesis protein FlhF [Pirellulaceae bacterium]